MGHSIKPAVQDKGILCPPILSVLTMEYFSRTIKVISTGSRFSHHLKCKSMNLSHLIFVDYLILFCRADEPSIPIMREALDDLEITSGLQVNHSKLQAIFGGISNELKVQLLSDIGSVEGQVPSKYLGIPSHLQC